MAKKQAEEAARREEERRKYAEMIASGKREWGEAVQLGRGALLKASHYQPSPSPTLFSCAVPKLEDLVSDSEEEPEPDLVLEIPTNKV